MLAIRLQRTGRKGHAQFRIIVQEARRTPSSGNVVCALGSYDPHTKAVNLDKDAAEKYLNNGAQPSPRMAVLLQSQGIKLPSWVKLDATKQKNNEKLRRNRPVEPKAEEAVAEEAAPEAVAEAAETVEETAPTEA